MISIICKLMHVMLRKINVSTATLLEQESDWENYFKKSEGKLLYDLTQICWGKTNQQATPTSEKRRGLISICRF